MRYKECLDASIHIKVKVNFMKFIQRSFIAPFEHLILRYLALLDIHTFIKGTLEGITRWWVTCKVSQFRKVIFSIKEPNNPAVVA